MKGWFWPIVVSVLCWVSYGLGIASVSSKGHIYYGSSLQEGLFTGQDANGNSFTIERSVWLNAVSGTYITAVILGWFAAMIVQISFWKRWSAGLYYLGSTFIILTAILETTAASLYTGNISNGYSGSGNDYGSETVTYGYGYYFMWVTSGLSWLTIGPYAAMAKYYKKYREEEEGCKH